jgi:hypothetical protein
MIVKFEDQEYKLDIEELDVAEATYIQVKTGFNLLQWQAALEQVDVGALKALYWLMRKQNGSTVDFELINFKITKFLKAFQAAQEAAAKPDAEADPTVVVAPTVS